MKPREFISVLDRKRIESGIRAAESRTSGEICVLIYNAPVGDAMAQARREFLERGLQKTSQRNAVLIFVAPRSKKFAVVGDEGVHRKCGDPFWQELASAMAAHFKAGRFTDGLVHGIARAGELLAEHFPAGPDDRNELPDAVVVK